MNEIASNTFLYVILSFAEELCSLFWTAATLLGIIDAHPGLYIPVR